MRILQVHNYYKQPGGEDIAVNLEAKMLSEKGHSMKLLSVTNDGLEVSGALPALKAGINTVWSQSAFSSIASVVRSFSPDVIHVHNFFPQLSPSVYWAAQRLGVPVVQTVHNYRLMCANALFLRNGEPCVACHGRKLPLSALRYRCYRDSLAATSAIVSMQVFHRYLGTFSHKVNAYIALSRFAQNMLVSSGFPVQRVYVKPNAVEDPGERQNDSTPRTQVTYVGRISREKGVDLLLEAWSKVNLNNWELAIVGDGPEKDSLYARYAGLRNVRWHGWLSREQVLEQLRRSRFLVVPSRCFEAGLPIVAIEALATGTPVIGPNHAAFPEIIGSNDTGFLFSPGDVTSLTAVLENCAELSVERWWELSHACRDKYLREYGVDANYNQLIAIYQVAMEEISDRKTLAK